MLIFLFAAMIALSAMPQGAAADGGMWMRDFSKYVYAPSQKAAIIWDGFKETLILSTKIAMDEPQDVAWVVPIQSSTKPEVTKGNIKVFFTISGLLNPAPKGRGYGLFDAMSGGTPEDQGVEVLEEKSVDIYDIAILRATSADVLVDWLNDNGYSTDDANIPAKQLMAGGNGDLSIRVLRAYQDEDGTKEVHLYVVDNSGSNTFNIDIIGFELKVVA